MEKSPLQLRAEEAAEKFKHARKPIVIEFAGVPKAGKTSTLEQVQAFFRRCGFRTGVIIERASVCPIRDKHHKHFNFWTICTTLAQLLEKTQDPPIHGDPDILFIDRGVFDSICWLSIWEKWHRISPSDRTLVEQFLRIDDLRKKLSAVIVMLVSPKDAMERERGHLQVFFEGSAIMNEPVLAGIRQTNVECAEKLKDDFRIHCIDTSEGEAKNNPKRTAEMVAEIILTLVEEAIKEETLTLPKEKVRNIFDKNPFLPEENALEVSNLFNWDGAFIQREIVDNDKELVEALPVVIIRNASGDILKLKRKEQKKDHPLHEEIVIWAGGHVRKEDAENGDPLKQCAIRELEEELRLNVASDDLHLSGAIFSDQGKGTSKHVAIAYEWFAKTDDVQTVLSKTEFFERKGTSVSGRFSKLEDLVKDFESGSIKEPWSRELLQRVLNPDNYKPAQMHLGEEGDE